jgi:hypothetical protein
VISGPITNGGGKLAAVDSCTTFGNSVVGGSLPPPQAVSTAKLNTDKILIIRDLLNVRKPFKKRFSMLTATLS